MRRRILLGNLLFVAVLLGILTVPLAVIYGRHEHDALSAELQRDAAALSGLTQEIIEHPDSHDVDAFTRHFEGQAGAAVVIVGANGVALSPRTAALADIGLQHALTVARSGRTITGELSDKVYVATPIGSIGDNRGAVLVARSDTAIDARVRRFGLILLGFAIVALSVVAFASDRLGRWATRPLRRLGDRAAALGDGDLHVRADASSGPVEVVALARRFNAMADRLDQLVASQRRFVADASHQLRTPLTALRLRLENLDTDEPASMATTRDAALQEMLRLSRIVDGLLALARAESAPRERRSIEVGRVVADRQEAWAPLAAEQEIDLRLGEDAPGLHVELVPGDLEQVIDNLVANALEATPSGSVVSLTVRGADEEVEIHVIDDGPGMSEADRRQAFAPFWQGDRGSTGSTGLGLAIVDQLVRANRGTIALVSSPGGGIDAVVRFRRCHQ